MYVRRYDPVKYAFRRLILRLFVFFAACSRSTRFYHEPLICSFVLVIPVPSLVAFGTHRIYKEKVGRVYSAYRLRRSRGHAVFHKRGKGLRIPVKDRFCIPFGYLSLAVGQYYDKTIFYALYHPELIEASGCFIVYHEPSVRIGCIGSVNKFKIAHVKFGTFDLYSVIFIRLLMEQDGHELICKYRLDHSLISDIDRPCAHAG